MWVELAFNTDDLLAFIPALAEIRAVIEKYDGQNGLAFQTAGIPAVRADVSQKMQEDMNVFTGLSFLFMFDLCFLFRTVHGVLIPMFGAMIPALMLLGVMGWMGEPAGLVSQVYPILIPAIAVADVIHVLSRFHAEAAALLKPQETQLDAARTRIAIIEAMKHVGPACFFTSFTTCVGFLSLLAADMKVMNNFGLYAGLGIAMAFITMVVAVPLMLSFVRQVPPRPPEGIQEKGLDRFLVWTGQTTASKPKLWLAVGLASPGAAWLWLPTRRWTIGCRTSCPQTTPPMARGELWTRSWAGSSLYTSTFLGQPGDLIKAKPWKPLRRLKRGPMQNRCF